MKIIVEKIFQSPSTPVYELAYFIKVYEFDKNGTEQEMGLIKFLEQNCSNDG